jgi:hypothetical protein
MKKTIKIFTGLAAAVVLLLLLGTSSGLDLAGILGSTKLNSAVWLIKRGAYAYISLVFAREGIVFLNENYAQLILLNPDPRSEAINGILTALLQLIMPFYVLAIILSAFYLLFVSGSPSGRGKAKKMVVRLMIGMMLVSQSPLIMTLFLDASSAVTGAIIKYDPDTNTSDVDIIPLVITKVFGASELELSTTPLALLHDFLTTVEIELGYFTMIPFILMVWGTLVVFFLRYAIIILWIILFPLAVSLYSFESTRDIGRNMLEQTIVWVAMQSFFAAIAIATAICIMQKPDNYMSPPMQIPGFDLALFDFIPFMGIFAMLVAPLLLLRIVRSFLP